jgi:hypothetical protein
LGYIKPRNIRQIENNDTSLAGRYISRRTGAQQIARFRLRICCVRMLGPAKHELWHYHQRRNEQDRNDKCSWHGTPLIAESQLTSW